MLPVIAFLAMLTMAFIPSEDFEPVLTMPEGVNNPMGMGKGLFPGRVVWVQDFETTSWDGTNGQWWDDNNTDQAATDKMMTEAVLNLTATTETNEAWETLFKNHNKIHGKGEKGYQTGEKIVVKVNLNASGDPEGKWEDRGYPSPHMVNALVKQLIDVVGVKGEDIYLADPSRYFVGPIYDKIRSNPSDEYQKIVFVERGQQDIANHVKAIPDEENLIYFNMPDGSKYQMCLASILSEAEYIINYALVRPHRVFGITGVGKNHFGSVYELTKKDFQPNELHAFALWDYPTPNKHKDPHSNPVLMGHKTIQSKTILQFADGLYTSITQSGPIQRFSTMDNDWFSSLLVSQDPVALESVVLDFISSEPNLVAKNPGFNGHQDSQLHEAALANNPPSGVVYDPENDGSPLSSLGVHEHWNNPKDKQYSRNLGKDKGIELKCVK